MCLVLSILMLVLSFNFYNAGSLLQAGGLLVLAIFFIVLMIRNILHVKKLKEEKKNDN